jgi:hypothetical protein
MFGDILWDIVMTIELRCPRDLALKLGVIEPRDNRHHRQLRDAGHLLVRDSETARPMFWAWTLDRADIAAAMSI